MKPTIKQSIRTAEHYGAYPMIERGPDIEVPRPRNGRPGYTWVPGWIVRYSETRVSIPVRLNEARQMLRDAQEAAQ
jgi:hypothetical protein